MFPILKFAPAKALPSALLGLACLLGAGPARAAAGCEESAEVAVLPSPLSPWKGAPLRVLFAAEKPIAAELSLVAPDGRVAATTRSRHGGPPYFWFAEVAAPAAGTWHARLAHDGATGECATITRDIAVSETKPPATRGAAGSIWPMHAAWNRATENLYSAWIEKLFDAPLDAEQSWKAWHEVLHDRSRNMLFNYLGVDEDNMAQSGAPRLRRLRLLPARLFRLQDGMPFGYSNCSRGIGGSPPKCYEWFDILHPGVTRPAPPPEQDAALRRRDPAATATVESCSAADVPQQAAPPEPAPAPAAAAARSAEAARAPPIRSANICATSATSCIPDRCASSATDDNTDFYTVPLTEDALRPGTVYADPYGHVLMLVQRVPEADGAPGVFLAVDAEPDGTVTRKRFWRGNFLFVHEPALGSPGFKRFRPIVRDENGALAAADQRRNRQEPELRRFFARAVAARAWKISTTAWTR